MSLFKIICLFLRAMLSNRAHLAAENLALRQQLAILQRFAKRPRLRRRDPIFWAWLSRLWEGWQSVLLIVKPETVIKWQCVRKAVGITAEADGFLAGWKAPHPQRHSVVG